MTTGRRSAQRAGACFGLALLLLFSSTNALSVSAFTTFTVRADEDYSKFSHRSDNHSRQACSACHQRTDNSATQRFPGHKDCTGCHLAQFVEPRIPMCNICHLNVSGSNPPLRGFPSKFIERFNVKFDHAQHNKGEARPSSGCAACHSAVLRRGIAMTIPVGINAHNNCFQCHSPGKTSSGRDISSCATCHAVGPYRRTSTNARAFDASFSHAEHGSRQRLNCTDCHSLSDGLPQSRQVNSPRAAQHFPPAGGLSCAACHNNKRAFGEKNYGDCARCHEGATFKFKRA